MVYALWFMPYGLCLMVYALWFMPYGLCLMVYALCLMPYGLCLMVYALLSNMHRYMTSELGLAIKIQSSTLRK